MRNFICFLFLLVAVLSLHAETIVPGGAIQGSWNVEGSPYRIMGDLSIASGTSLLINPGVDLIFMGTYKVNVAGRILASGTLENPISITAQDTLDGWSGIRFTNTGGIGNLPSGFTHTHFSYGKAIWGAGGSDPLNFGGAIWASNAGTISFDHCQFSRCKSIQDGSAIYAKDGTNIVMQNCIVKSCESGFFGGVFVKDGTAHISDCEFESNTAVTFASALYFYNCGEAFVSSCKFLGNVSGAVTCIYSFQSPLIVVNSLFAANNTTMGMGGGIGAIFGTLRVNNCSFVQNSSAQGGAAIWMNSLTGPAQITNSIFWENTPVALTTTSTSYVLQYCSTAEQEGDETNIWGDPLFVDIAANNYGLSANSPCIDAGTPDVSGLFLPEYDLAGAIRIVDGNSDGSARIDMGCYERQAVPSTGLLRGTVISEAGLPIFAALITVGEITVYSDENGSFEMELNPGTYNLHCSAEGYEDQTLEDIVIIAGQNTNVTFRLIQSSSTEDNIIPNISFLNAHPNPFASQIEIKWEMKGARKLEIFNLRGQLLRSYRLSESEYQSSIVWDGRDTSLRFVPSGIYFCRISSLQSSISSKIILKK